MDLPKRIFSRLKMGKRAWGMALTGAMVALVLITAACSAQGAPAKATWVKPQTSGDLVSVSVADVTKDKIVHFSVPFALGTQNFMAYDLGGQTYVRANVCPPCRSVGFALSNDRLICDTCKTVFNAKTGEGISGACVAYPKAAVTFQNSDGKLTMKAGDLLKAYQNTLEQGWP